MYAADASYKVDVYNLTIQILSYILRTRTLSTEKLQLHLPQKYEHKSSWKPTFIGPYPQVTLFHVIFPWNTSSIRRLYTTENKPTHFHIRSLLILYRAIALNATKHNYSILDKVVIIRFHLCVTRIVIFTICFKLVFLSCVEPVTDRQTVESATDLEFNWQALTFQSLKYNETKNLQGEFSFQLVLANKIHYGTN